MEEITEEDVATWHRLPAIPKHDNKQGRPSAEHLAAAKAAKDGRRAFVEGLVARLSGAGGGELSIKAVEAALNASKPAEEAAGGAAAAAAAAAREERLEKVTSPVSSALELDGARVILPLPKL